jgi:uncharacterized SAM-binding protein YcdF (DUF218 family)
MINQELIWILKAFILPPGLLILTGLLGLLMGRRLLGKLLTLLTLLSLYVLSTAFFSAQLLSGLEHRYPALSPAKPDVGSAEAIVVLGADIYPDAPEYGGDTISAPMLERARYAAWLHFRTGLPIITSGGAMEPGDMPASRAAATVLEKEYAAKVLTTSERSLTTWEESRHIKELMTQLGLQKIVLVTHAWHMPRAVYAFQQSGIDLIPAPTAFQGWPRSVEKRSSWLPDAGPFFRSVTALHEYVGIAWYRARAFIDPPPADTPPQSPAAEPAPASAPVEESGVESPAAS